MSDYHDRIMNLRCDAPVGNPVDCSGCAHGEAFADSDLSAPACKTCKNLSNHTGMSDKTETIYRKWIDAMTVENRRSKGEIAAELAWQDKEIERLREALRGIVDADCEFEGLSSAYEFVRWAKQRARNALMTDKT